ncbi:hypothetical protein [Methanobacterium alcaliphilum]|uniref:hypothetical protein n=1 Tax=Methanobacterium alcaliphilum TaxID=392018 RepID=UPI00200B72F4|nr:hypothetical protein [Methanobacterium alcaliphilum]MCK9152043.1 hypothetical protein [Methanobacterium alcaliphilum]
MVVETFTGSLIYSHIAPAIVGFLGILFICIGIMDRKQNYTIIGVIMFFAAGLLPFLILPAIIGS